MAKRLIIARVHGRDAGQARGVVVVIDVLRAFTVAAYALAGGARQLCLVRTVEEAQALRAEMYPDALLAGEVGGRMIPGFDLNNSPARMQTADVRDRIVIQRTGAGTQGAVNARHGSRLLVASLVNARATATYAANLANAHTNGLVTLVPTANAIEDEGREAIEDEVCAAYLEALLDAREDAGDILARGIAQLYEGERLGIWTEGSDDFPADDVPSALAADRFSFAMEGERDHVGAIEYIAVRRVDVAAG
ncbi:MAG TPA: 2-phosphosulfolactate phosphatase [Ktedonobacterales bacterium]|nr:2-phosphosulfolactate phosphatase [Ktedonobacterales bacterium]